MLLITATGNADFLHAVDRKSYLLAIMDLRESQNDDSDPIIPITKMLFLKT